MTPAIVVVLLVGLLGRSDAQVQTVTITFVTTSTAVATSTVNVECTKLVNVTAACRKRRGILIEEPIVLTFADYDDYMPVMAPTPVHL